MFNQLDAYHPYLALGAAGVGVVVAVVLAVIDRPRGGGRLAVTAAVAAGAMATNEYVDARFLFVVVLVGLAIGHADRRPDVPWLGLWTVVSLAGVWAAVPDTEAALVAVAITAVPVLTGRTRPTTSVDRLAAAALVVTAALIGSGGRVERVGGIGCVGLLAAVPMPVSSRARSRSFAAALLFLHAGLVATASRVLTRWDRPAAVAGVVAIVAVAMVVGWAISEDAPARPARSGPAPHR